MPSAHGVRADASTAFSASRGCEYSHRAAHGDINGRQVRIAAKVATLDLNIHGGAVSGADRDGPRPLSGVLRPVTGECFIWRENAQSAVRAFFIPDRPIQSAPGFRHPCLNVPAGERIQPALDAANIPAEQNKARPELKASKKSLDFSVQKRTPHACSQVPDALPAHGFAEPFTILGAAGYDGQCCL